jgi:uncharacterized protein (TIGR00369 family)
MPIPPAEMHRLIEEMIPFNKFLGIKIRTMADGFMQLELPFRPELIGDPFRRALHGGTISTLIDTCGGFAVWTQIALEDRVSTIDLRVDYLSPGRPEALIAEANVVRVGNRVGVTDMRCFHESDPAKVIATGKGVYNIKRAKED